MQYNIINSFHFFFFFFLGLYITTLSNGSGILNPSSLASVILLIVRIMFTFGYSFLFSYKNASEISGVKLIDIIYIFGNAYYMVIVYTFKIPSKPDSPNLLQLFNSNISSLGQDYAIYIRVLSPTYGIPPNFNCFNFCKLFNRPIDESLTFVDPVKISVLQFEQSDAAEITESFTSLVGMNDRSKYSISTLDRAINSAKRSAYKFSTVAI